MFYDFPSLMLNGDQAELFGQVRYDDEEQIQELILNLKLLNEQEDEWQQKIESVKINAPILLESPEDKPFQIKGVVKVIETPMGVFLYGDFNYDFDQALPQYHFEGMICSLDFEKIADHAEEEE